MKAVWALTKRNLKVFTRDRSAVFFSFISIFIFLGMYFIIFRNQMIDGMGQQFPQAGKNLLNQFANAWAITAVAGLLSNNQAFSTWVLFVQDYERKRRMDFGVSPVKSWQLLLSYLLQVLIYAVVLTTLTLVILGGLFSLTSGLPFTVYEGLRAWLATVYSMIFFASLFALITSFLSTQSAFGGVAASIGTLLGFVQALYIPLNVLPEGLRKGLSYLPFVHSTRLISGQLMTRPIEQLSAHAGPAAESVNEALREGFANVILWKGQVIPVGCSLAYLGILSVIFFALAMYRMEHRVRV